MTEPVNLDRRFGRQLGFFNPSEHPDARVTFVGVGGIGSFAAFGAAKLGIPRLTLVDMDTVEEHNAPNQFHAIADIGKDKVAALASQIERHIGTEVSTVPAELSRLEREEYGGVVVSGLDSMAARRELWEDKIKMNPAVPFYIDGRIAGQLILIYAFCPYDIEAVEHYEATLHSDEDAEPATCTERGLIDVGYQVGGLIVRNLRKHYTGEEVDAVTYMNQDTLGVTKGNWIGA